MIPNGAICLLLYFPRHFLIPDSYSFNVSYVLFLFIPDQTKFSQIMLKNKKYTKKIYDYFPCASYVRIIVLWSLLVQELGRQYLVSLVSSIAKPIDVSYSFLF